MSVKQDVDAMVSMAMDVVNLYREGGKPDSNDIVIDGINVDKSNVANYLE